MNFDLAKLEKFSLDSLNKNSINSFDFIDGKIISCCESELNIFNLETGIKSNIYSVVDETEELGCFKIFQQDKLFLSNENIIQLFDLNLSQQINKFKFSKDTINSIKISKKDNILACCDDSGEIKLLDVRTQSREPCLSFCKSLNQHDNICYALEFHPANEHELFSGSFDCTFIKWDIRFQKKDSKKPFIKKVAVSDEIQKLIQIEKDGADMLSSMTPSFIHSLYFIELPENKTGLMCGTENGYAMLFDSDSCKLIHGKQITNNLAVSQFNKFEKIDDKNLIATSGDSKLIEFIYLNKEQANFKNKTHVKFEIRKFEELSIKHGKKVNCVKYKDQKLYLSDTSNDISIYNFKNLLNKS
ncbi:WD repeat-containing 53 [Brachionus plicatilis]|uniref:WD repeat-containing 53 n=1 Tax=Brachionus plicatilis TaxID=10195 RepID=A0A3M7T8G1_BRAPC|nr:WD repeat-containing 53 [Brachionus plicatilis]